MVAALESEFLHEEVHMLINLEPVEIVGVALEPHEQAPVADVGAEPPLPRPSLSHIDT